MKNDVKRELQWIWEWTKYVGYYAWQGTVFLTRASFKIVGFLFTVIMIGTVMSMIDSGRGED